MNTAFDFDGVISANFALFEQLAYWLTLSGHKIFILTGAKDSRAQEIKKRLSISNSGFITRPKDFISTPFNIGTWKKIQLIKYDIDLWFENEVKQYEQAGVDFSDIKTQIVRI